MARFEDFISENVALSNTRRIGIYDSNSNRVGQIPLGNLTKYKGKKLYSFGAISDVHLQYETATVDFRSALNFLNNWVDFICICGDLTANGTATELSTYKQYIDQYAKKPVFAISGNHEGYNSNILSILETYTEKPLYYSFEQGNDIFIMVGVKSNTTGALFTTEELQWLYETLEANRNKRCFIFQHVRPDDSCGNALGVYKTDIWGGTEQIVFENLLKHYPNVIFFHGHSHLKFSLQKYSDIANVDKNFGCWSVHIPSLSIPRDTTSVVNPSIVNVYADSEGYVIDVYENGIHLKGRDFIKDEYFPIASYWLDTTLKTVEAGTFTDSTGTLNITGVKV